MALQEKKIMPPPWLAHREIERYSIGWRMGYGEDYIYRFGDWLDTLSPDERTEYRTLFPEPVTWTGWWDGREPYFGLELWFLTSFQGKPVWALNREHLAYMIGYLSADLREKPMGRAKMTQADHLPTFMKTAKNRERIVKLLKKLQEK